MAQHIGMQAMIVVAASKLEHICWTKNMFWTRQICSSDNLPNMYFVRRTCSPQSVHTIQWFIYVVYTGNPVADCQQYNEHDLYDHDDDTDYGDGDTEISKGQLHYTWDNAVLVAMTERWKKYAMPLPLPLLCCFLCAGCMICPNHTHCHYWSQ